MRMLFGKRNLAALARIAAWCGGMGIAAPAAAQGLPSTYPAAPAMAPPMIARRWPDTMEYVEGQPVPPGYSVDYRTRRGLAIAGGVLLSLGYSVSFTLGAVSSTQQGDAYWPLFVPVVGPFIAIGTFRASTGHAPDKDVYTAAGLGLGVAQLGSAAMLVLGLATGRRVLVRQTVGATHVSVQPIVGASMWGLTAGWEL